MTKKNYLYWMWKNYFTPKHIKDFNKAIIKNIRQREPMKLVASGRDGLKKKQLQTSQVLLKDISIWTDSIIKDAHYINEKEFGFNLNQNFQTHDSGNYNIYSSKTKDHYKWHIDCATSNTEEIKFTVLVNLSEKKYQGGELKLFQQDEVIIKEFVPGSIVMFKSHLNHCVTPVTTGERRTFTIFITGPLWR